MVDADQGGRNSTGGGQTHVSEPAQRLYALVLDFAERSLASQEELIRTFEAEAAQWAPGVGEVVIDDDDDEHLRLTLEGRFAGRVVDDETGQWETVGSPDRVAAHYDPVDLFNDLADALEELFPALDREGLDEDDGDVADEGDAADAPEEEAIAAQPWRGDAVELPVPVRSPEPPTAPESVGPPGSPAGETTTDAGAPPIGDALEPFREQLRALEDLRNAGVLTPAQFEAAKANLTRR